MKLLKAIGYGLMKTIVVSAVAGLICLGYYNPDVGIPFLLIAIFILYTAENYAD